MRQGGAAAAAISPGDIIRKVNGEPTASFDVRRSSRRAPARRSASRWSVPGTHVEMTVTPVETELKSGNATVKIGLIGIERSTGTPRTYLHKGAGEALETALANSWFITSQSVLYVGRMLSGSEGTGQLAARSVLPR